MNLWVGLTDDKWFEFLRERRFDEVNFWKPSEERAFKALKPGEFFLFLLKMPRRAIIGGGIFNQHSFLPLSVAWDTFKEENGVSSYEEFRREIYQWSYGRRKRGVEFKPDPVIGCIIITQPFFLNESDWIPEPADWSPRIVAGKTYNTQDGIGASLGAQVQDRLKRANIELGDTVPLGVRESSRYGSEQVVRPRLGQGAFRVAVTDAYDRRCAVTGERTLPVLIASHIKPYSQDGPHAIQNGLLLRADLHLLFDRGYMTITRDLQVEVSKRIKEDYENGREYYAFHGKKLVSIPGFEVDRPSVEFIEWHNQNIFYP